MVTRFFDVLFSLFGLLILFPFLLIISLLITLDSKGGVYYRQKRVGQNGRDFNLLKFRSMRNSSEKEGYLTIGRDDPRITKFGKIIRKYKIDELPQLMNILCGEMSFVGPRPEVRRYVDLYSEEQKKVLSVKPGLTDYASILFKNENEILARAENAETLYLRYIMPRKIKLNMIYINRKGPKLYFKIIFFTLFRLW